MTLSPIGPNKHFISATAATNGIDLEQFDVDFISYKEIETNKKEMLKDLYSAEYNGGGKFRDEWCYTNNPPSVIFVARPRFRIELYIFRRKNVYPLENELFAKIKHDSDVFFDVAYG